VPSLARGTVAWLVQRVGTLRNADSVEKSRYVLDQRQANSIRYCFL